MESGNDGSHDSFDFSFGDDLGPLLENGADLSFLDDAEETSPTTTAYDNFVTRFLKLSTDYKETLALVSKQKEFFDEYRGIDDSIAKVASEAAKYKKLYRQTQEELAKVKTELTATASQLEQAQSETKAAKQKLAAVTNAAKKYLQKRAAEMTRLFNQKVAENGDVYKRKLRAIDSAAGTQNKELQKKVGTLEQQLADARTALAQAKQEAGGRQTLRLERTSVALETRAVTSFDFGAIATPAAFKSLQLDRYRSRGLTPGQRAISKNPDKTTDGNGNSGLEKTNPRSQMISVNVRPSQGHPRSSALPTVGMVTSRTVLSSSFSQSDFVTPKTGRGPSQVRDLTSAWHGNDTISRILSAGKMGTVTKRPGSAKFAFRQFRK